MFSGDQVNKCSLLWHRCNANGRDAKRPENSIASAMHAIDNNAQWIEVDLRATNQSTWVLSHDPINSEAISQESEGALGYERLSDLVREVTSSQKCFSICLDIKDGNAEDAKLYADLEEAVAALLNQNLTVALITWNYAILNRLLEIKNALVSRSVTVGFCFVPFSIFPFLGRLIESTANKIIKGGFGAITVNGMRSNQEILKNRGIFPIEFISIHYLKKMDLSIDIICVPVVFLPILTASVAFSYSKKCCSDKSIWVFTVNKALWVRVMAFFMKSFDCQEFVIFSDTPMKLRHIFKSQNFLKHSKLIS